MVYGKRKYKVHELFTLVFRAAPVYAGILAAYRVITACVPTLMVLVNAAFIDTALQVARGEAEFSQTIIPTAFIIANIVLNHVVTTSFVFLDTGFANAVKMKIRPEMLKNRAALEYRHIENEKTQDLIARVTGDPDGRARSMFDNVTSLLTTVIGISGILSLLFIYAWWAALLIIAVCAPLFYIGIKAGEKKYGAEREMTKVYRLADFIKEILTSRDSIEERYIFGYTGKMNEMYVREYEKARLFRKKVDKRNFIYMKGGSVILSVATVFMSVLLIIPTVRGDLTVGLFASLIPAMTRLTQMLSWSVTWQLSEFAANKQYLKDLTEFMELSTLSGACDNPAVSVPEFESLEFRNVVFTYPGTEAKILDGLSFKLDKGRHYSIVGQNGSGKTTLVKLITGLYDNYEGEILLNGKNLREYSQAELKAFTVAVFQDFARYPVSVGDNIALGDVNLMIGDAVYGSDCETRPEIKNAAVMLGIDGDISALDKGYDTELGKIDDKGAEMSGGQWQRIAMARAVVSKAPLRILDEPTASLDPVGESLVYSQVEEISRGGTTIFISHRLGSTKLADIILVIEDGSVIESGAHDELMKQNGVYAEMYRSQAQWYSTNEAGA